MQPNGRDKSSKDKQPLRTNAKLSSATHPLPLAAILLVKRCKTLSLLALLAAISSGALLTLAFAPTSIWPLAIICPAVLLFICQRATTGRHAFFYGELFGFGFFGSGLSWIYVSLHTYGQANVALASFMTLLMVLVLAIYIACACYLLKRFFPRSSISQAILAFPCLWVLAEWLRGWLFTGFPWLFLGYSQIHTPLRGLAPIMSVYGLSWIVAASSGLLVVLAHTISTWFNQFRQNSHAEKITSSTENNLNVPRPQRSGIFAHCNFPLFTATVALILIWLIAASLANKPWTQSTGKTLRVSLVQGDIPIMLKWRTDQAERSLQKYTQLSATQWRSDLVIWPEAAVTFPQTDAQPYLLQLAAQAKKYHSTLLAGIPIQQEDHYYNGMLAIGQNTGVYLKRHLVPFGEFIPFRNLIAWLSDYLQIPMSDFSAGDRYQTLIRINTTTLATFICYEIAYPTEVLDSLPAGQVIVVISDDSWFGKSLAARQHLQIAQMRALETGRPLVMATNDGLTAVVDAFGTIQTLAPPYQTAVLSASIIPRQGSTPWVRSGIYPWTVVLFSLLLIAYLWQRRRLL